MKIELIEQFKTAFTDSLVYADLATEYTSFEIFEINNGKFELEAVQQAYQNWSKQNTVDEKRAHFAKDLDKLVSGDYVLVPKKPTAEMERAGMSAGGGFLTCHVFKAMCAAAQGATV
ncbi:MULTISPECIES: hypothetical protein [unclassified Acinetobacter]|uniref:hypothetical protein n=1 Tax=unclassified Acinetobacter TaxID=196816 RepID=UPI00190C0684|nr:MULTISPECIES: hypothetical protein [unclassified Acinetobacter]MBK0063938.1 hypothetical protein [Acinetobacter sp. S55]MBK0067223.1 hypothetical protein [Acinetobacter sp. S54]